jgi:hypothetical protein
VRPDYRSRDIGGKRPTIIFQNLIFSIAKVASKKVAAPKKVAKKAAPKRVKKAAKKATKKPAKKAAKKVAH